MTIQRYIYYVYTDPLPTEKKESFIKQTRIKKIKEQYSEIKNWRITDDKYLSLK